MTIAMTMRAQSILPFLLGGSVGFGVLLSSCLPERPEGDIRRVYEKGGSSGAGGSGITIQEPPDTGSGSAGTVGSLDDPNTLSSVSPNHGPFKGGTRVIVRGQGFTAKPTVFFGGVEVPATDVVALSPKKIQVVSPAGAPGPVDVRVQNGDDASTSRTLASAFTYDAFFAEPNSGPTQGGTKITLRGAGTTWGSGEEVSVHVGTAPCTDVTVVSANEVTCITPGAPAGAQSITVKVGDESAVALDAYTYADSENGYKGGLSGAPLAGQLTVLAFDSYTGKPLTKASVFVGDDFETALRATIDGVGTAVLVDERLTGPQTVTVAFTCYQPTTFVAAGVDHVTMFLDPVIAPACVPPAGDPPPVGGRPGTQTSVSGEVVFPNGPEFQRAPWTMVPNADEARGERRAAYLFPAAYDPKQAFYLPDPSQAILESANGTAGYGFAISAPLGNYTMYALAGIEDRSTYPGKFTAYAFGLVKGISALPGEPVEDVAVSMDIPIDHAVTLNVAPPSGSSKGPDRVQTTVAVSVGNDGYAIFPGAQKTTLLPLAVNPTVVGLPPLVGALADSFYVSAAKAGTGAQLTLPVAVVDRVATKSSSTVVSLDGFVQIPKLQTPSTTTAWDGTTFDLTFEGAGLPPNLLVFDVSSGNGTTAWTITAPPGVTKFKVPDLRKMPKGKGGLEKGPLTITVSAATLDTFDYDKLQYRHLGASAWRAYARDAFFSQLPP
jgi:hypothetical protein